MRYEPHDRLAVAIPARTTEPERESARLTVVESCPEDALTMLEMLGLLEESKS